MGRFFEKKNFKILEMEMLGPSLEDLLNITKDSEGNRKFSLKTICMLAIQMIDILQKIHKNNIVHRDLKPHNFLMGLQSKLLIYKNIINFSFLQFENDIFF